jgi:hypothetical protein
MIERKGAWRAKPGVRGHPGLDELLDEALRKPVKLHA